MVDYFHYDLVGEPPACHSSVNKDAILRDVESQLMSDDIPNALTKLTVPVHFLQAPRGIMNDAPLYPMARLAELQTRIADFRFASVADVNHYTIMLAQTGADAVMAEMHKLLGRIS